MTETRDAKRARLKAELVGALASDARMAAKTTGKAAAAVQEARIAAHDAKLAAARAELDAADKRVARRREQRYGRLATLGSRLKACRRALAAAQSERDAAAEGSAEWAVGVARVERLERLRDAIVESRARLFCLPIDADELGPNGRFVQAARKHDYAVGMLATDVEDIVQIAAELCLHGREDADYVATDAGPMPTIGGMYRNLKRAHRSELDAFRQIKRGRVRVDSEEELRARGIDPADDPQWVAWKRTYVEPAEHVASGPAPRASHAAVMLNHADAELEQAHADMLAASRRAALASAAADKVSRALVAYLLDGFTLEEIAEDAGRSVSALTRRLTSKSGQFGATFLTMAEQAPEPGSKWDGIANDVKLYDVREEPIRREGWTRRGETFASSVKVERMPVTMAR